MKNFLYANQGALTNTLHRFFSNGVLGTGWINAIISIALLIGLYWMGELYVILNHGPAVLNLKTSLDEVIPLVPIFVIPYVSLIPLIPFSLVIFLMIDTRLFQSLCLAFFTTLLISYGFYFFLQTEVIRPTLTGNDVFTQMIKNVYSVDNPYNDFPSLHTSLSVILAVYWLRLNRPLGMVIAIWTALIVASTLLIKQHYVADPLFGLVLAFGVTRFYTKRLPDRTQLSSHKKGK